MPPLPHPPCLPAAKVKRMVVSTYQAASGAGQAAMEELELQTREVLDGERVGWLLDFFGLLRCSTVVVWVVVAESVLIRVDAGNVRALSCCIEETGWWVMVVCFSNEAAMEELELQTWEVLDSERKSFHYGWFAMGGWLSGGVDGCWCDYWR